MSGKADGRVFLGIFEGHYDPAVAAVRDGRVIAYAEEERHLRFKHAPRIYPRRALDYCLKSAGVTLSEVAAVGINWNLDAYTDGTLARFFESMRSDFPVDQKTIGWQNAVLRTFNSENYRGHHHAHWRRAYGDIAFPALHPTPHHYVHALHACGITLPHPGDETLLSVESPLPHDLRGVAAE